MPEITIQLSPAPTRILIEHGLLDRAGAYLATLPAAPGDIVLITDATVGALHADRLVRALTSAHNAAVHRFDLPPGEASKNLSNVEAAYDVLARRGVHRDALIVALGGGMVSDLAGFAAATWMRGIRWAIIPTTLEAQIDAAIGGKTAVNLSGGKNLVGAFHHPEIVLIDPDVLATLPHRDYVAGLAESVKHAAVFARELFEWHEQHIDAILRRDPAALAELIERNVRIKAAVVERDPFEKSGQRILLNFGHTIGHAIEALCGFRLRHGECVSLGMIAAGHLSAELVGFPAEQSARLKNLLAALGLPAVWKDAAEPRAVLQCVRRDKKSAKGSPRFVLLRELADPAIHENLPQTSIESALRALQLD